MRLISTGVMEPAFSAERIFIRARELFPGGPDAALRKALK